MARARLYRRQKVSRPLSIGELDGHHRANETERDPCQDHGDGLELAPPLIINKDEIDEVIPVLDACITEEEKAMGLSK